MVRTRMSSYFVPFTYLLASGFLFSAVSAGPEPVHDISDPKLSASAFVQHNLSSTAKNLPAGSIESTSVALLPGVQGLGITTVIFTLKQGGYATPHWHPRASELFTVFQGQATVAFITADGIVRTNTLVAGDATVFPRSMLHWWWNSGSGTLVAHASLDAEDPGALFVNQLFKTIPADILEHTFDIGPHRAKELQKATNLPLMF